MLNINNIMVTGYLQDDLKHHGGGFVTGRIGINNSYQKDGEWVNRYAYMKLNISRKEEYVDQLLESLHKGDHVYVEGSITQGNNYTNAEGQTVYGQPEIRVVRILKTIPNTYKKVEEEVTDFDNIQV